MKRPFPCLAALLLAAAGGAGPADAGFTQQLQFGNFHTICVSWADHDGDGDLDLAVGNVADGNQLFTNNGDGTFTESAPFGTYGTFAAVWGDVENDGDPDMAVMNTGNDFLYLNQGGGTFTRVALGSRRTNAAAWADFDLDGDLDLAAGNGLLGSNQVSQLYVNDGAGTLTPHDEFGTGQASSLVWGDFDADGDPDLAVAHGGFGFAGQNQLYVNNGNGTFTPRNEFGTGDDVCVAWGDADNDGDQDLAVGDWEGGTSSLYVNNGDGTFTELPRFGARDTNTLAWGDFDNDGDQDVAAGNGDFASADSAYLYVNAGGGSFTEMQQFGLGSTDGLAWGDCDGDGDLDMAVGNEHTPTQNYLYVNNENGGDWLLVLPVGQFHALGAGYSNRDGIGAKILVYEAGRLGEAGYLLGFREVEAHSGFSSQNARAAHFGLPGSSQVDVRIVWPGSAGRRLVQDLTGVAVGQQITVVESGAFTGVAEGRLPGAANARPRVLATPNPSRGEIDLSLSVRLAAADEDADVARRIASFTIHDTRGRVVARVAAGERGVSGAQAARWDGRARDGSPAPSGIYYATAAWNGGAEAPVARPARFVLIR